MYICCKPIPTLILENDTAAKARSVGGFTMKRAGAVKFPNSVQLFKFCQKVLMHQRGAKVRDQEIGNILEFNPSDCSHWKRGEKNVKSVFALAKLAETLQVEAALVHDVASGNSNLDEAYFEFRETKAFREALQKVRTADPAATEQSRQRIEQFVAALHEGSEFRTPPLYLPEVLRTFSFINSQPIEMLDRLSRILRVRPGHYTIQYKKGDMRPQTRMSVVKDLARIVFEAERARFPELGPVNPATLEFEEMLFAANLLIPKNMLLSEMTKIDLRRNAVSELATLFWVPKSLISFQMQDSVRVSATAIGTAATANAASASF